MTPKEFNKQVELQFERCRAVLEMRKDAYAPGSDRLHNFKKAGHLQHETPEKALYGMMTKHIIALSDFIERWDNGEDMDSDNALEYITDKINYLLLLRGLLLECKAAGVDV